MRSYVVDELRGLVNDRFPASADVTGVFGHSMGGHGALTLALSHPEIYQSVSAFAPICAPSQCRWGTKAFGSYLGVERDAWRAHDATELVREGRRQSPILIDQGDQDQFSGRAAPPPVFFQPPAPTPVRRSNCGCNRATTTATTSSRHSWVITSRTTRAGSSEAAQGRTRVRSPKHR